MPRDTVLTLNLTDAQRGKWWWDNRLHMALSPKKRAEGDLRFAAYAPEVEAEAETSGVSS